jgi:long-chain fatty acid transport protein
MGNAFAGETARGTDASTIFYNPAGMAHLSSDEVDGNVSYLAPTSTFQGSNSSPLGGTVAGTSGGNAVQATPIGSVFAVYAPAPAWRIGLSVDVPYGLRTQYPSDWVGRYQALTSQVTNVEIELAASWQITDHLSIGGGPRLDYLQAQLTQALNMRAIGLGAAQQLAGLGQFAQAAGVAGLASTWGDGQASMTGSDWAVGYGAGALYTIDASTRLGIAYRSRIDNKISTELVNSLPSTVSAVPLIASNFTNQSVSAKITLPDSANVGLYHDINSQWTLLSDVQWTDWSVFRQLDILNTSGQSVTDTQEHWRNTWFLSLGADYRATSSLTLHAGLAYETTPVTDPYRNARIPDCNRRWLGLGASYAVTKSLDLHISYAHIFGYSVPIDEAAAANTAGGTLLGAYAGSIDMASAGMAFRF